MKRCIANLWSNPVHVVNAAYAGLLVFLAVVPRSLGPEGFELSDGVAHAIAYGIQGALLTWALRPVFGAKKGGILAVAGVTAFGLFTELLQSMLPYRDFGLGGLGADAIGAFVGVVAALACGLGLRKEVGAG